MVCEEAENCKLKANELVKDGKYEDAVKEYNKAISLDNANPVYYSNRSAAWAQLGKFQNALNDANKCLEVSEGKFVKGYNRKGFALYKLGKVKDAEAAYQGGLVHEPDNAALKQAVGAIKMEEARKKAQAFGAGGPGKYFQGKGGLLGKVAQTMSEGGLGNKLMFYVFIFLAYYLYNQYMSDPAAAKKSKEAKEKLKTEEQAGQQLAQQQKAAAKQRGVGVVTRGYINFGPTRKISFLKQEAIVVNTNKKNNKKKVVDTTTPSLLLIHAYGMSSEEWRAAAFGQRDLKGFHKIAIDMPCHGESSCWDQGDDDQLYEKIMKKLVNADRHFNEGSHTRLVVLSEWNGLLSESVLQIIKPHGIVWSHPYYLSMSAPLRTGAQLVKTLVGGYELLDGSMPVHPGPGEGEEGDGSQGEPEVPLQLVQDILDFSKKSSSSSVSSANSNTPEEGEGGEVDNNKDNNNQNQNQVLLEEEEVDSNQVLQINPEVVDNVLNGIVKKNIPHLVISSTATAATKKPNNKKPTTTKKTEIGSEGEVAGEEQQQDAQEQQDAAAALLRSDAKIDILGAGRVSVEWVETVKEFILSTSRLRKKEVEEQEEAEEYVGGKGGVEEEKEEEDVIEEYDEFASMDSDSSRSSEPVFED